MPVSQFSLIRPGLLVSIVLKADQKTGRQVQGTVSQILTRHNHPRGIKVKLTDGRVGRVQRILAQEQQQQQQQRASATTRMASNNPWSGAESAGNPYTSPTQSTQGAANAYFDSHPTQPQSQSQQHQQPSQQQQYHSFQPPQQPPRQQQQQQQQQQQPIRRSDTDQLIEQQADRAEQFEYMQQYEANAQQTEDDRIQAQLQKEFPNIDSSLIAAIYNERKGSGDLAEVRELLQELNETGDDKPI